MGANSVMLSITVLDAGFAICHALLVLGGIGKVTGGLEAVLELLSGLAAVGGLVVFVLLFTFLTNKLFGHDTYWRAAPLPCSAGSREPPGSTHPSCSGGPRSPTSTSPAIARSRAWAQLSAGPGTPDSAAQCSPRRFEHGPRAWPAHLPADACLGMFEFLTLTDLAAVEATSSTHAGLINESLVWSSWAKRVFPESENGGRTVPVRAGLHTFPQSVLFAKDPRSRLCLRRAVTRSIKRRAHVLAADHRSRGDAWVVVRGRALDVSGFLERHPGGEQIMLEYAGKDATNVFDLALHSATAHRMLEEFVMFDPSLWLGPQLKGYFDPTLKARVELAP